jgi:hypothetical protein
MKPKPVASKCGRGSLFADRLEAHWLHQEIA